VQHLIAEIDRNVRRDDALNDVIYFLSLDSCFIIRVKQIRNEIEGEIMQDFKWRGVNYVAERSLQSR
jgi:hypothetical protein